MKKTFAMVGLLAGLALTPVAAQAQERLQDGLLGAGAGALVGGPVGAVVGGAVGYTSGPRIADGIGAGGRRHYRHAHYRHYNRHAEGRRYHEYR